MSAGPVSAVIGWYWVKVDGWPSWRPAHWNGQIWDDISGVEDWKEDNFTVDEIGPQIADPPP